jgi:FMN-dependent NADH-azoreductase
MTQSEKLIAELETSDVLVIATPMHNYTVPAALKTWIDHVVRVRRTFHVTPAGKVGALRDLPVFIAISSGGRYSADQHSGGHARQPNFLTPYLTTVLATIGLNDVTFFSVEGTAYGPDALVRARDAADERLEAYFSSFTLNRSGGRLAQATS